MYICTVNTVILLCLHDNLRLKERKKERKQERKTDTCTFMYI